MKNKESLTIKKVKIDDHIKSSGKKSEQTTIRKRGRPRKSGAQSNDQHAPIGSGIESFNSDIQESINGDINNSNSQAIQPVYDTTEEAKGFLRAPFDIAAGLTGIPKLALYPQQLDALAPSFKVVYDKRIAPYMGDNADLIAFVMVFSGIAFEKVGVFKEEQAKRKPKENVKNTDSSGTPFIPMEHVV